MATSPTSTLPTLSPANAVNPPPEQSDVAAVRPATLTRKEWVVPPRPKPGRKAATDVPPTKRKAQNRAAQRAFRERRAAKVEELEEQMREMEAGQANERNELVSQIGRLEAEVERFTGELLAWQSKSQGLEREMRRERNLREEAEREILTHKGCTGSQKKEDQHETTQETVRGASKTKTMSQVLWAVAIVPMILHANASNKPSTCQHLD